MKMDSKPGRKPAVPRDQLLQTIERHAKDLVIDKCKIIHKRHEIWKEISSELENKILPDTLYSIVTNNKYDVRTKIIRNFNQSLNSTSTSVECENTTAETSNELETLKDQDLGADGQYHFTFSMTSEELDNLITTVNYSKRKDDTKTLKKNIFKPYQWETVIIDKIWHSTHRKCGFNFKNHYITHNKTSGSINGKL